MSWQIGYDENWKRDIGYGVPATCDHPGCETEIHRGISYVCGSEPYGGEHGCGLYFCAQHLNMADTGRDQADLCERCFSHQVPFTATPDRPEWVEWKLTHPSWQRWRDDNPEAVASLRAGSSAEGRGNE